jgi:dihydroflavonol-4-reductase
VTTLVTGATGLTGANVCRLLRERGDDVRAFVRSPADAEALRRLGVEVVEGDVTDAASVRAAVDGCDGVIHTAALLGGDSQELSDFVAVNQFGTSNVFDAAAATGAGRVVALSTGTFFDTTTGCPLEQAPVLADPSSDPYTVTKLAAFRDAHARAEAGQDVVTCHPGAIFGSSPVPERALHRTSFNRVLLAGVRGKLSRYLSFPVIWVFAENVARGAIAALDHGVAGERYWLDGRPEDVVSTAECCNRLCAIAGVDHHVEDLDPDGDTVALEAEFGPTLLAIARDPFAVGRVPRKDVTPTSERLGYDPIALDDGLERLVRWLRDLDRID